MTSARSMTSINVAMGRGMILGGLALMLACLPVTMDRSSTDLSVWSAASAKQGSDKGGGRSGGNGGTSNRPDEPDHAGRGDDTYDRGHQARQDRKDQLDLAKGRYARAFEKRYGPKTVKHGPKASKAERRSDVAYRFSHDEVEALLHQGWDRSRATNGVFKNHGERVRTYVAIAKELGYSEHVGALQANFGNPYENGIAELEADLEAARTEQDRTPTADGKERIERLEADLAAAISAAKPGRGPDDSWAVANLDVDGNGRVDQDDLNALRASQ